MKNLILFVLAFLIFCSTNGQDFRKANWGMSPSQVKSTESLEIIKEDNDVLAYKTTLADFDAYVVYIFAGNKLTRAKYIITETHSNKNDYISDYNTLKSLLQKKYGTPVEEEKYWKDDLYKDDYSDWGFAVSLGHLIYYSTFKNENTDVTIMLSGENYEIDNVIEYTSKSLGNVEQELRAKEQLSNFSINGFRYNAWGDNQATVKTKENFELIQESSDLIAYKGRIAELDMMIGYLFTNNKLTTGKYLITEDHSNKNDYITDYNKLKGLLTEKYGAPKEDEKYWKDDLYKDDYSDWGFAVSLGHLVYYATYENEKSEITLMLRGENYEISLLIEAKSKELKDIEKNAKEKKVLDDF